MDPKISVIMSVYNAEGYLREAVESVLGQSVEEFEFLIVDDASSDGSTEILQEYARKDARIRILPHGVNRGLTASLNEAIGEARGEYLARQDADDVSRKGRLAAQVAFMEARPEMGLVGTRYAVVDEEGRETAKWDTPLEDGELRWRLCFANAFCHSSVMMRRAVVERVMREGAERRGEDGYAEGCAGPYDEGLRYSQDFDLWGRMAAAAKMANLDETLVEYRVHEAQIGRAKAEEQEAFAVGIALRNMRRLVGEALFTEAEMGRLRGWVRGDPAELAVEDLVLLRRYAEAVERFGPGLGMSRVARLRAKAAMMRRALLRMRPELAARGEFAGLVRASFRGDPAGMTRELGASVARRLTGRR